MEEELEDLPETEKEARLRRDTKSLARPFSVWLFDGRWTPFDMQGSGAR